MVLPLVTARSTRPARSMPMQARRAYCFFSRVTSPVDHQAGSALEGLGDALRPVVARMEDGRLAVADDEDPPVGASGVGAAHFATGDAQPQRPQLLVKKKPPVDCGGSATLRSQLPDAGRRRLAGPQEADAIVLSDPRATREIGGISQIRGLDSRRRYSMPGEISCHPRPR